MYKILFLLLLLLASCSKSTSLDAESSGRGKFALTYLDSPERKTVLARVSGDSIYTDVDLGLVKGTTERLFIPRNSAESPLTNVKITSSNPAIKLTPNFIPVLDISGDESFVQILQMTIVHGLDPITNEPLEKLLPYGKTDFYVEFEGISNGDTIRSRFDMTLAAIYVDLVTKSVPADSTAPGYFEAKSMFPSETAVYNGDSCSVFYNKKQMPYDVYSNEVYINYSGKYPIQSELDSLINSDIKYFGDLVSDCVIKTDLVRKD